MTARSRAQIVGQGDLQVDAQGGPHGQQLGQRGHHHGIDRGPRGADAQQAGLPDAQLAGVAHGIAVFRPQPSCVFEEDQAGRGQLDAAAAAAVEQHQPGVGLQPLERFGQCRLRDGAARRGPGQIAVVNGGQEILDVPQRQIHKINSCFI
jgi:hypothetical protein